MSIVPLSFARLFVVITALGWLSSGRCLATPVTVTVSTVTVLHDGRSVLIEAIGDDPAEYGAVDWVQGWINENVAVLNVSRGNAGFATPLVFTGASIRVQNDDMTWTIYAWIPDAGDVVSPGDTLEAVIDDGWLEDSAGNTLDGGSSITYANYSIVGTNGFIDEGQFSFGDEIVYVNLHSTGEFAGNDRLQNTAEEAWEFAHDPETPLLTLSRALDLHHEVIGQASACAIRIKRGTTADSNAIPTIVMRHGGTSLLSPFLISTYGSGARPIISFPDDLSALTREPATFGDNTEQYIYINGIHLQRTGTDSAETAGFQSRFDDHHLVVSDCKIEGFTTNVEIQGTTTQNFSRWWSIFRNIITDAHDTDQHTHGIFIDRCQKGLLISQNVIDQNGYKNNDLTLRDTFSHNIYVQFTANAGGAFLWGNAITRGGALGCKIQTGGAIYANLFAENALGGYISGHGVEGGGRIARNYFERGEDLSGEGGARGWGPGLGGSDGAAYGPSILELNCVANSDSTGPLGVWLDQSNSTLFTVPELIVRNNTARGHGPFAVGLTNDDPSPPVVVATRNVWDSRPSEGEYAMIVPHWTLYNPVLDFYVNLYKSHTSSSIETYTPRTLAEWQSDSGVDANSITNAPTYADSTADLADLAVHVSAGSTILQYYAAMRGRAIGEWDLRFDFVYGAAWMIGKYEVSGITTTWPNPDPMPWWGAGDGSDPLIP